MRMVADKSFIGEMYFFIRSSNRRVDNERRVFLSSGFFIPFAALDFGYLVCFVIFMQFLFWHDFVFVAPQTLTAKIVNSASVKKEWQQP